jgi:cytoskeleton-associated protein 5
MLLIHVLQTMDLRSLLLAIHGFFEALGVNEIRRRSHSEDKPLRMVKTILHELCKLKGTDIYRSAHGHVTWWCNLTWMVFQSVEA